MSIPYPISSSWSLFGILSRAFIAHIDVTERQKLMKLQNSQFKWEPTQSQDIALQWMMMKPIYVDPMKQVLIAPRNRGNVDTTEKVSKGGAQKED